MNNLEPAMATVAIARSLVCCGQIVRLEDRYSKGIVQGAPVSASQVDS